MPQPKTSLLIRWLRLAYDRARQPVGYVLVIAAVVGGFTSNTKLQIAAVGLLAGMIVRLLFEIRNHVKPGQSPRRFPDLAEARHELETCLLAALKKDGELRIQWIGMTLFNVWGVMEHVFDWLATEVRPTKLRFEVAMLAHDWLDQNRINSSWTGASADVIAQKIDLYKQLHHDKLLGLDWEFQIQRYAHMPILHGGLINDRYLFIGLSRWEESTLKAGDRMFELYTFRDGEEALDRIAVFSGWFRFCFTDKPTWYEYYAGIRQVQIDPMIHVKRPPTGSQASQ